MVNQSVCGWHGRTLEADQREDGMDGAPLHTDRQVIRSAHFPFDFAFAAELLRLPDGQRLTKDTDDCE
jgi:hypothetical protein